MKKGIDTDSGSSELLPEDDIEFERRLAEEERRKREEAEQRREQQEKEARDRERKAREERDRRIAQDKLDLIKMKQGIANESETIKEVHEEHRELHGREKLANIWYHDKTWILLGAFLIAVVSFLVYDTVSRVQPDIQVLLICDNSLQLEMYCSKLENRIAQYTPDLNGDGKVSVNVISCPMNEERYDTIYTTNSQKFFANLQQGRIIMVITDENTDPDLQALMTDTLPEELPGNPLADEKGLSLNNDVIISDLEIDEMPEGVHLCLRTPVNTLDDSLEKMQANYDTNLEIIKAMAEDLNNGQQTETAQSEPSEPSADSE